MLQFCQLLVLRAVQFPIPASFLCLLSWEELCHSSDGLVLSTPENLPLNYFTWEVVLASDW